MLYRLYIKNSTIPIIIYELKENTTVTSMLQKNTKLYFARQTFPMFF